MPDTPSWTFVLCDHEGTALGDLAKARNRKLTYTRNAAHQVEFDLDIDDDRASDLVDELKTLGIPRLQCYRDGVLRAHAFWQPMTEQGVADQGAGAGPMHCTFRGPFAKYENFYTSQSVTITAADAGGLALGLIKAADAASSQPARLKGGDIETTVDRDRIFEHKQIAEAIQELTNVDDGFDFDERLTILPSDEIVFYTNLVKNGSYETSATDGWTAFNTPTLVSTAAIFATNGAKVLQILRTGVTTDAGQDQPVSVISGQRYYMRADVYLTAETQVADLWLSDGVGFTGVDKLIETVTGIVGAATLEAEFVASATTTWYIKTSARDTAASPSVSVFFDSVMLVPITEEGERPTYFDGDSPNARWTGTVRNSTSEVLVEESDVLAYFDVFAQMGSDISNSVFFEFGDGTRQTALSMDRQTLPPLNRVRVLGDDGIYAEVQDAASIERYGLYMGVASASDGTVTWQTLRDRAFALLRPSPLEIVTCQPDPTSAPQPFDDYYLGDTVGVRAREGSLDLDTTARINSIEIDLDDEGNEITHTLTFDQSEAVV